MAGIYGNNGAFPIHLPPVKRGKGPYLYDYDENRYVDFELSRGSLLLGHAPAALCSTVKSWLNRGYASGYPVASSEMLSGKLQSTLGCREEGRWLFYNSAFEAGAAVLFLMKRFWKREKGVWLSDLGLGTRFSPFSGMMLRHGSFEQIADLSSAGAEFIVFRAGRSTGNAEAVGLVSAVQEKEAMVISDETDIEGHTVTSRYPDIAAVFDMRVFGSFLSSGLPFGCIWIGDRAMKKISDISGYRTFADIASFSYSVPLYLMKSVIRSQRELEKLGGIEGILQKADRFYQMLGSTHFELSGGLVYLKEKSKLETLYPKIRLELLQRGFYFPLSIYDPTAVSFAHSEELLQKSAREITSTLSKYIH
jgi:glutamate-1-semialdehyde aminotransferase